MTSMKQMAGAVALGAALLLGVGLNASPAQAAYIATLAEVGSDVVATGSGSFDTLGLSGPNLALVSTFVQPVFGSIFTGPPADSVLDSDYTGFTGPLSFGGGTGFPSPDSGSGDI